MKKSFLASLLLMLSMSLMSYGQKLPEEAEKAGIWNINIFSNPLIIKIQDVNGILLPYGDNWENFLIEKEYLKKVPGAEGKMVYRVTEKLEPYIVSKDSSVFFGLKNYDWYVIVGQYRVKSIDKVEKMKLDDDKDLWRFSFYYYVSPILPDLPPIGSNNPLKGYTGAVFNSWTEEWDIYSPEVKLQEPLTTMNNAIDRYGNWMYSTQNSEKEQAKR